jgi:glutamyl endopeptidase
MKKEDVQNDQSVEAPSHTGTATTSNDNGNVKTEYEIDVSLKNADAETVSPRGGSNQTSYEIPSVEFGTATTEKAPLLSAFYGSYSKTEIVNLFPNLNTRGLETIIGEDNRVRVNPPTGFPWQAICALRIQAQNGQMFVGTGWLVAPRTVITAGHCVYLHDMGGWASSIEVIPAMNGSSRPFGSAVSSNLRTVNGWMLNRSRESDYGCIILPVDKRLGDSTGYFGFAVRNDSFLSSALLNLSGYPQDKGSEQQWFMAQRGKSVSEKVITYDIDTYGGQSGSPVWVFENGNRYGVGVHTNGHSTGNSATRITQSVYDMMLSWRGLGS